MLVANSLKKSLEFWWKLEKRREKSGFIDSHSRSKNRQRALNFCDNKKWSRFFWNFCSANKLDKTVITHDRQWCHNRKLPRLKSLLVYTLCFNGPSKMNKKKSLKNTISTKKVLFCRKNLEPYETLLNKNLRQ